jgi:cell division protein FtsI (penicillin-binding protein 3)
MTSLGAIVAPQPGAPVDGSRVKPAVRPSSRGLLVFGCIALAFAVIGAQLVRLAVQGQSEPVVALNEPLTRSFSRPDIVDRNGRLVATDLEVPSLYADPALLINADEVIEKLRVILPDLDEAELGRTLREPGRRFAWIRRGVAPHVAQRIHNLGIPGIGFRKELRRAYPLGRTAGHVLGAASIDNKGLSGIERHIDDTAGIEAVLGSARSERPPLRLSIDIGVQHGLEDELKAAMARYGARGAAGLIMEARTGAVVAAGSLPDIDPARPVEALDEDRSDKLTAGTWELGSIFKMLTIAMALDAGQARLDTVYDVREPLTVGRFTIKDLHPLGRPLTVEEIFVHSSNVGAGMIALEAGPKPQQAFLARLGLTGSASSEAGPLAPPQLPQRWDRAETTTISYGHGLAVAPLQFAAAAAALVNGGLRVRPTFLVRDAVPGSPPAERVISSATSARMRELMRLNVSHPAGTGRRAEVTGYEVGGKTGTAEMPVRGGYKENAVISSFIAAFPMSAPRYVVLVLLFEPTASAETRNQITAGVNAAPATGRIIARVAPLLGVTPVLATRQ